MSKEIKIGILTFIVLLVMVWGYTFLKGRNLLTDSNTYFAIYDDVTDLAVSSPVLVNGYKVGTVTKIMLNEKNTSQMVVYFDVHEDYKIPRDAEVALKSMGFVNGRGLFIEIDKVCSGADCAPSGSQLKSKVVGLVESMLGEGEMENYSADLSTTAQSIIAGIGKEGQEGAIHETFRQLEQISKNLAAVSLSTQVLLEKSSGDIQRTMKNLSQITDGIAKSNKNIESLLKNVDKISQDIAAAEVDETAKRVNNNLDELKLTLNQTSQTLTELNSVIKKADQGDGSVAKLLNDAKLYENMEATTRQLNLLLQDLRLNPKRYAHFSVFGKKNQNYTLPAEDPANK